MRNCNGRMFSLEIIFHDKEGVKYVRRKRLTVKEIKIFRKISFLNRYNALHGENIKCCVMYY